MQCDDGLEYKNNILNSYCINNKINLVHSGVKHHTTNGVVEIVHQDIVNSLISQKLQLKNKYDISFCLSNAVYAHNNNIHETTKLSPKYLFNNYEYIQTNEIENRMIKSQNYAKKKLNPLINGTKVLISNNYKRSGRNIKIKFTNKGKYIIPGTVEGEGNGTPYPICIDVDINDLIKGYIYLID